MIIKTSDLCVICEKLITYLNDNGIESINLSKDYYWHIPKEEIYDPYHQPIKLNIGDLTDDWADLEKVLNGKFDPLDPHFLNLAAIFRAIGDQIRD